MPYFCPQHAFALSYAESKHKGACAGLDTAARLRGRARDCIGYASYSLFDAGHEQHSFSATLTYGTHTHTGSSAYKVLCHCKMQEHLAEGHSPGHPSGVYSFLLASMY